MPRTASRAIRASLLYVNGTEPEGLPKRHYYNVPSFAKDYYLFCTVRNPYDRLVSLFLHRTRHKELNISFDKYVKQINLKYDIVEQPITLILKRYKLELDYYIKFEDLPWSFEEVPILKDEKIRRFMIGVSPSYDVDDYYTSELIEKVKDLYSEDFKAFKYEIEYEG